MIPRRVLLGFAAFSTLALAECSSDSGSGISSISLLPKPGSFDSMSLKSAAPAAELRPVTAADFVDPQGHCAGADANGARGGIALQMTECEVVSRAGPPDNVEVGTNERGERSVTMTYTGGPRPGVYRFAAGRLNSIERSAEPPPEPAKPKKPAAKKSNSA